MPVGLAAAILRVPFLTHDSDTMPGLANRIIARWAKVHATGMPENFYSYPKHKTKYVGIPLASQYVPVDDGLRHEYKKSLGVPDDSPVVLITGGSLGARRLNQFAVEAVSLLMEKHDKVYVFHQTGKGQESIYEKYKIPPERLKAFAFSSDMFRYSGAADVVITRGGATTIAEFALQGKACIIVPNPDLAGGHQLKNAEYLSSLNAAIILQEAELSNGHSLLFETIMRLLQNESERKLLATNILKLSKPHASNQLATLILEITA